jgi:hypothetical protein
LHSAAKLGRGGSRCTLHAQTSRRDLREPGGITGWIMSHPASIVGVKGPDIERAPIHFQRFCKERAETIRRARQGCQVADITLEFVEI